MDKLILLYYCIKFLCRSRINKLFKVLGTNKTIKPKYPRKLMSENEGNKYIKELLLSDKPFVAGRFGSNELNAITSTILEENNISKISDSLQKGITNGAGLFPDDKEVTRQFGKYMLSLIGEVDYLGCWNNKLEDYIVKYHMHKTKLGPLKSIEPYYYSEPWSLALKGKKVLVIHPFAESISLQKENYKSLFLNEDVLPDFKLYSLKSVQTIAGMKDSRFETWFDALDYMFKEAMQYDFDIALIGCGAYGLPLSIKLKEEGKQVIHMGGALQILFGIKGKRWDENPNVNRFYNEFWIRPNEREKVKNSKIVEDSCYW